ncbi:MAG TPA: HEAT repeat domain-containing protein [Methanoregula sp.]|nr:HEAT repeat domain-containing protein [Methanoregula sp.]
MSSPGWLSPFLASRADVGELQRAGDIAGLVRLLGARDDAVSREAVSALAGAGRPAVPDLIAALGSHHAVVRLGSAGALGTIGDPRAVPALARLLESDRVEEVRWQAAIAMGRIGSREALPVLIRGLRDRNRYVRLGSAEALTGIGWHPESPVEQADLLIALQDWEGVRALGPAAARSLREQVPENDPATKKHLLALLAGFGDRSSEGLLRECMKDPDHRLRWQAVSAGMDCGIAPEYLPRIVSRRTRDGPVPAAAALLNFLFLGIGYNYIGKWWGFPVFMSYTTLLVLAQLAVGPVIPYLVAYPITALFAIQTYFAARKMSDF